MKKFFSSYKKMSVVAKASLWFLVCTIIQKCLALLTTPIFTRIMDTEQYGYFSTYLSFTTILTVILTFNFDTCAYMNGISKFDDQKKKDELASSLLCLTALLTTAVTILTCIFGDQLSQLFSLPKELFILMMLEILFIPPVKFWMVKQRFAYKYVSLVLVILGMLVMNNALGIVGVLYLPADHAFSRVLAITVVQFAVGIVLYVYFFMRSGWFRFTKYWRHGLKLNLPLIPHGISIMVLSFSDKIMINSMVGPYQAGIYGVAYNASQIINALKLSIVDALRPWFHEKLKNKRYGEIKGLCRFIFLINILMTFIIVGLAPEIIMILAAPQYYDAIYIIPPVAASSYFTFIYNICAIIEMYYERNKRVMVASVIAAVTNVVLNYLLIPVFGYLAAGYTTLVSYIVLSVFHLLFVNSIKKEEMDGYSIIDGKTTVLLSLVVLAGMLLFTVLYSYIWLRLAAVLVLLAACFLMRKRLINTFKAIKRAKKAK